MNNAKGVVEVSTTAFFVEFCCYHTPKSTVQNTKLSGQPLICQLLSFLPKEIISSSVLQFESDKYYKTMTTYKQLVFMLYGVISKSSSLNSLCKSMLFLEGKLSYLGIKELPASSTLSDANRRRDSQVFEHIYYQLLDYYKDELQGGFHCLPINNEASCDKIKRFDATTFTLFSTIFKGAGRNAAEGNKKGGVKAQTLMPYDGLVPEYVHLGAAAKNDKDFLGQLQVQKGYTYVFDKGYVNYHVYQQWDSQGVYFVTRLNENASYKVTEQKPVDCLDIANDQGVIKDELIELKINSSKSTVNFRLVTYNDPNSGKTLRFLTNQYQYSNLTIALIYKNRWAIEPFFKQLKQSYQLSYFFSDKQKGIMTQIWIALIANLIFTIIFQRIKQAEQFTTIVNMARCNMGSYICFLTLVKQIKLDIVDRNNEKIQMIYSKNLRGVFWITE